MIKSKVAFIGAGQMGGALLRGMLGAGVLKAENVWVSDKDSEKTSRLKEELGVQTTSRNKEAVEKAEIVFLAIKPQQLEEVISETTGVLHKEQLIVSILAGVSTGLVGNKLGGGYHIIRVMPNSPALVGKSISVISRGREALPQEEKLVGELFSAVGEVVFLDEDFQNKVTALSGSGPAYFYLLVEKLVEAGKRLDLSQEIASKLIFQTIAGAVEMLQKTNRSPEELRKMVTSPGGTTEAALEVFQREDFGEIVWKAVDAAVKRAQELGR